MEVYESTRVQTRLYVADDHPMYLDLKRVFAEDPDLI